MGLFDDLFCYVCGSNNIEIIKNTKQCLNTKCEYKVKTNKSIKFIELFGGIGGFRYGLEKASKEFQSVFFNDINKYAVSIYNENYKEENKPKDIRKIRSEDIPNHDLLTAGFPCQSFSIAGKRKGFEDTRGTLFFEIARIAKQKQPSHLLLENVRGLLSHDEGRTFRIILETLDEMGYDAEWEVLNSKYFGVPQNRERVFIVGHFRTTCRCKSQVFPIGTYESEVQGLPKRKEINIVFNNSPRTGNPLSGGTGVLVNNEYVYALKTSPHFLLQHHRSDEIREFERHSPTITKNWGTGGNRIPCVANCLTKSMHKGATPEMFYEKQLRNIVEVRPMLTPDRINKRQNGRRFKENNEESFTVTKADRHGVALKYGNIEEIYEDDSKFHDCKIVEDEEICLDNYCRDHRVEDSYGRWGFRRLTPIEGERLQGFPDNWTKKGNGVDGTKYTENISDTRRYQALGNAVTTNVIRVIGERLLEVKNK